LTDVVSRFAETGSMSTRVPDDVDEIIDRSFKF
jgi:hypothetical protein